MKLSFFLVLVTAASAYGASHTEPADPVQVQPFRRPTPYVVANLLTTGSPKGLLLVQNKKPDAPVETSADKPPRKTKDSSAQKRAEKKGQATTPKQPRQPQKPKRKPENSGTSIKPFNPSEKIDADQAVDFPYDI